MEETKKIGFFKRVKYSIFNLENYKIFASERFSKAMKYLLLIVLIATLVLSIASTVQLTQETSKLISYIENEFPDFTYADGKLEVVESVNAYDKDYDARLISDTGEDVSDTIVDAYKEEAKDSQYSVILLNDKLLYKVSELDEYYELSYTNIASTLGIDNTTKSEFVENYFNTNTKNQMCAVIWIYAFISIFMMNFLTLVEDVLIIGVFGWIAAKLTKVALKFSQTMSLAIYSLTLSIILSTTYSVVNSFCNFEIKYFSILYMIIAYIYIVAAIMIMKEEINKTAGEAVTIEGQVIKTSDDEEKVEEEKEDNKKDKKPEEPKDKTEENKEKLPEKEESKNKPSSENKKENKQENKEEN